MYSNSSMSFLKFKNLETIAEVKFQLDNIELMRLYFNEAPSEDIINEFKGGYIIMTNNSVMSLRFDSHVFFLKKFDNLQLQNLLILYHKFMLVQFKNENYFEIYNVYTGDLIRKQEFKTKIKCILCKTNNDLIINVNEREFTDLVVILEKSELHIISLKDLDLKISPLLTIQASGIEYYDCSLNNDEEEYCKSNKVLSKNNLSELIRLDKGYILNSN